MSEVLSGPNRFSPVESMVIAWISSSGLSVFLYRGAMIAIFTSRVK